jgi:hypothetical protein
MVRRSAFLAVVGILRFVGDVGEEAVDDNLLVAVNNDDVFEPTKPSVIFEDAPSQQTMIVRLVDEIR